MLLRSDKEGDTAETPLLIHSPIQIWVSFKNIVVILMNKFFESAWVPTSTKSLSQLVQITFELKGNSHIEYE